MAVFKNRTKNRSKVEIYFLCVSFMAHSYFSQWYKCVGSEIDGKDRVRDKVVSSPLLSFSSPNVSENIALILLGLQNIDHSTRSKSKRDILKFPQSLFASVS